MGKHSYAVRPTTIKDLIAKLCDGEGEFTPEERIAFRDLGGLVERAEKAPDMFTSSAGALLAAFAIGAKCAVRTQMFERHGV